jgi:hypothetical protein
MWRGGAQQLLLAALWSQPHLTTTRTFGACSIHQKSGVSKAYVHFTRRFEVCVMSWTLYRRQVLSWTDENTEFCKQRDAVSLETLS